MPAPAVLPKVLNNYASWAVITAAVDAILPPTTQPDDRKNYVERLAPNDPGNKAALTAALVPHLVDKGWLDRFNVELISRSQTNTVLRGILSDEIAVDQAGVANPANLQSLNNKVQPFLTSRSFFEGMETARYRVCAIWVHHPDPNVNPNPAFRGTGFLVGPDLVLTARHVIEGLVVPLPAGDVPVAGSEQRIAFVFDYWASVGSFDVTAPPDGLKVVGPVAPQGNPPTSRWLEWSSRKHPNDGVTHLFGPPPADQRLDCAIIRLAERVGAASTGGGGGKLRGWQRLNAPPHALTPGSAIALLQHPSTGPQMFDKGDFVSSDPQPVTRLFYSTNANNGSSGSPCFNATPEVVGFHNAGHPTQYPGQPTSRCNQGVSIDRVIASLEAAKPDLLAESRAAFRTDDGLWSLSDNFQKPEPVLGRTAFKEAVFAMFDPHVGQRVLVVSEQNTSGPPGKSGKSFSTRILRAMVRRRPAVVVEFSSEEMKEFKPDKPEKFLLEIGRRIGLGEMPGMPEKPEDERQWTRWWSNDLPAWFGRLLEDRAKNVGLAVNEAVTDRTAGPAAGDELVLRELVWIVIDDIHKSPPSGGLKELIAGLVGVTDTQQVLGPGLKSMRWLMIGHIPDFVREYTSQFRHDVVAYDKIGLEAWKACIRSAVAAAGKEDRYNDDTVEAIYDYSKETVPALADPVLALKTLAGGVVAALKAIKVLR